MKHLLSEMVLAALALTMATAQAAITPPPVGQVCLRVNQIQNTTPSRDGSAITFTMSDGKVWRNTLRNRCPDLNFNGFVWVIRDSDEVCENAQTLRVLNSGEICGLGKFTLVPPPAARH